MARELGLGGSERQLTQLALHLPKDRFQVHIACFSARGVRLAELMAAGIPILKLELKSFLSLDLVRALWRVHRYGRQHGITIFHAFDFPGNFLIALARALSLVPCALTSQRSHRELRSPFWRRLLRWTDRRADGIVVNCESVKRQLIEQERVPAGRVHLCYNGLDPAVFTPLRGQFPKEWPEHWTIDPAQPVVAGCVAALRIEKGLPLLLEAAARIRTDFPALRLLFVGDGPHGATLQAEAAAAGLAEICYWQPATGNVAPWLQAIDVFVLPSLSEALSNSLMEAMACGCAVIASRTGGNPELVADGEDGLLFTSGDVADLELQLRRLLAEPALRARLGAAAHPKMKTGFTMTRSATRMAEIYGLFRK